MSKVFSISTTTSNAPDFMGHEVTIHWFVIRRSYGSDQSPVPFEEGIVDEYASVPECQDALSQYFSATEAEKLKSYLDTHLDTRTTISEIQLPISMNYDRYPVTNTTRVYEIPCSLNFTVVGIYDAQIPLFHKWHEKYAIKKIGIMLDAGATSDLSYAELEKLAIADTRVYVQEMIESGEIPNTTFYGNMLPGHFYNSLQCYHRIQQSKQRSLPDVIDNPF